MFLSIPANGFYMYTEASQKQPSNMAQINSSVATAPSTGACIRFWYHMYGRDIETLRVYMMKSGDTDLPDPAWSMTGDKGNYWHRATIDVPVTAYTFRVGVHYPTVPTSEG